MIMKKLAGPYSCFVKSVSLKIFTNSGGRCYCCKQHHGTVIMIPIEYVNVKTHTEKDDQMD